MLSSVLRLKKCLGTFLKSTTKQRNQNTSFKQLTIAQEKETTTTKKWQINNLIFEQLVAMNFHFQHLTSFQLFLENFVHSC